jgi:hypothetical protein
MSRGPGRVQVGVLKLLHSGKRKSWTARKLAQSLFGTQTEAALESVRRVLRGLERQGKATGPPSQKDGTRVWQALR